MRVKFCPKCGSRKIDLVAGGKIGMWECSECKFRGGIFPEKEVKIKKRR